MTARKVSLGILLLFLCSISTSYSQGDGPEADLPAVNRNMVQMAYVGGDVDEYLHLPDREPDGTLGYFTKVKAEIESIIEYNPGYYVFFRQGDIKYRYKHKPFTREELKDDEVLSELEALINDGWQFLDMAGIDWGNDILLLFRRNDSLEDSPQIPDAMKKIEMDKLRNIRDMYVKGSKDAKEAPGDGDMDTQPEFAHYLPRLRAEHGLLVGFAEHGSNYVVNFSNDARAFQGEGLYGDSSKWLLHVELARLEFDDQRGFLPPPASLHLDHLLSVINELEASTETRYRFLKAARVDHSDEDDVVLVFARLEDAKKP